MKNYEMLDVEGENKIHNWNNTFISFTNARIESLRKYKDLYLKDYNIIHTFVLMVNINTFEKINSIDEIKTLLKDSRVAMLSSKTWSKDNSYLYKNDTGQYIKQNVSKPDQNYWSLHNLLTMYYVGSGGTHNLTNGVYISSSNGQYKNTQSSVGAVIPAIVDNKETYYFQPEKDLYVRTMKNTLINAFVGVKIGENQYRVVSENTYVNKTVFESETCPYYYIKEVKVENSEPKYVIYGDSESESQKKLKEDVSKAEKYHIIVDDWFQYDNTSKKIFFNNILLGYRQCFFNSFPESVFLLLGGAEVPPSFTAINNKILTSNESYSSGDFSIRVQNPLSGYVTTGYSKGGINFFYEKDLSDNFITKFKIGVGTRRIQGEKEVSEKGSTETQMMTVKFISPNTGVKFIDPDTKVEEPLNKIEKGVPIAEGFMPLCYVEERIEGDNVKKIIINECFCSELVFNTSNTSDGVEIIYTTNLEKIKTGGTLFLTGL